MPIEPGSRATAAAVFAGGFAGGLARYALVDALPGRPGGVAWGVLLANTTGSFLLGLLLTAVVALAPGRRWVAPALGTGFCGSFTTMSALAVGVDEMAAGGTPAAGGAYLVSSLLAGMLAVLAGARLGRRLLRRARP